MSLSSAFFSKPTSDETAKRNIQFSPVGQKFAARETATHVALCISSMATEPPVMPASLRLLPSPRPSFLQGLAQPLSQMASLLHAWLHGVHGTAFVFGDAKPALVVSARILLGAARANAMAASATLNSPVVGLGFSCPKLPRCFYRPTLEGGGAVQVRPRQSGLYRRRTAGDRRELT
jgi:hypothetical protein